MRSWRKFIPGTGSKLKIETKRRKKKKQYFFFRSQTRPIQLAKRSPGLPDTNKHDPSLNIVGTGGTWFKCINLRLSRLLIGVVGEGGCGVYNYTIGYPSPHTSISPPPNLPPLLPSPPPPMVDVKHCVYLLSLTMAFQSSVFTTRLSLLSVTISLLPHVTKYTCTWNEAWCSHLWSYIASYSICDHT